MRIEYGKWKEFLLAYIDAKRISGIISSNSDILNLVRGLEEIFAPWRVGIITCTTEANPANIQTVRLVNSAEGYPNVPPGVVAISYLRSWKTSSELNQSPCTIFCDRIPAGSQSARLLMLKYIIAHELCHCAGYSGHNPNPVSIMNERIVPEIRSFTPEDLAILNVIFKRRDQ